MGENVPGEHRRRTALLSGGVFVGDVKCNRGDAEPRRTNAEKAKRRK